MGPEGSPPAASMDFIRSDPGCPAAGPPGKMALGQQAFFLSPDVKSRGRGEITGTVLKEVSAALWCKIDLV